MSLIKLFKNVVNKGADVYSAVIVKTGRIHYAREYKSLPERPGEKEWLERWRDLQKKPSLNCYRKYYDLIDEPANIIPIDLMNTVIQPILNPNIYRPYYLDKNSFEKIYGKDIMPVTVLRNFNGRICDADFMPIELNDFNLSEITESKALIAKPTRDSYGGRHILLFNKKENGQFEWNEDPEKEVSVDLLNDLLGNNWILQEKLMQHDFMAQFNESSVNTFRTHIYTSPVTGKTDVAAMCMRVGAKGNWFDNIHSGGFCVSVDLNSGVLGSKAADGKGNPAEYTNDIDLVNNTFVVPNFDKLKEFAIEVGKKVIHHHSLAADIMMDEDGNFKLIEVNIGTFDANMFMATGVSAFGKYTDEVIDYCKARKNEVRFVHVIPW